MLLIHNSTSWISLLCYLARAANTWLPKFLQAILTIVSRISMELISKLTFHQILSANFLRFSAMIGAVLIASIDEMMIHLLPSISDFSSSCSFVCDFFTFFFFLCYYKSPDRNSGPTLSRPSSLLLALSFFVPSSSLCRIASYFYPRLNYCALKEWRLIVLLSIVSAIDIYLCWYILYLFQQCR